MEIIVARTEPEMEAIRRLFREYEAGLGVDLCFQNFEAELAGLPGQYASPHGVLLLAKNKQHSVGCGALRRFGGIDERTCEMKRLYVRPEARGLHIGRALARRLITEAGRLGYGTMLLDTLDHLRAAIGLYESLGFVRTAPYYPNPLPGVLYWKLDLKRPQGAGR